MKTSTKHPKSLLNSKYLVSYLFSAGLLAAMSNGSQAQELKPSSQQTAGSTVFTSEALFGKNIIKKQAVKYHQQQPNLKIAQKLPQSHAKVPATSQDLIQSQKSTTSVSPHQFYIGPDLFYRTYNESVPERPSFKSYEFGTLYGIQANYNYLKKDSIYAGVSFRYASGATTYDGSTQDGTPLSATTDNQFLNAEGRLGYTFSLDKQDRLMVSPFLGIGYHQWDRDNAPTFSSNGSPVPGNLEIYSWGYIGSGVQAKYQISPQLDVGLNAKLMMMVGGNIISIDRDANNQVTNVDGGGLGNTLQYEVELPITYHLAKDASSNIDLKLIPYYRSQNIARGPLFKSGNALEPASNTSVYGVTLGAQLNF
jgi:hypothetical protein